MRNLILTALLTLSLFAGETKEQTPPPIDINATIAKEKALIEAKVRAEIEAKRKAQAKNDKEALEKAYAREYAFLKAQKEALKSELSALQTRHQKELNGAEGAVETLQDRLLGTENMVALRQEMLIKAQEKEQSNIDNSAMVGNTISQAKATLEPLGLSINEDANSSTKTLGDIFVQTAHLIENLSSITKSEGSFYLRNGDRVDGEIINVGNIAAFGISDKASGALAPAGDGRYKLWNAPKSEDTAKGIQNNPATLNMFIYENLTKEVEEPKVKTVKSVIDSGGIIGWVIVGLGGVAVLLMLIRVILLLLAGANTEKIINVVSKKVENCEIEEAKQYLRNKKNSTAKVMKATLRNIDHDREHVEDIIVENILNESSSIDRFGSTVLVLAAVAPLLGLLGTVTGMIATFDIITEFGTGDPKLLAGGISIALVTTELGLIVAIPALLFGNLLTGWATSIKDKMEQGALHVVNTYEANKEKCK